MSDRPFRALLTARQREVDSLVCVGLDPLEEQLPPVIRVAHGTLADAVAAWMCDITDATAPFASMFKPQHGHWEAIPGGSEALQTVVAHIHARHPGIPVMMDCKRGDIDRTQAQYRKAHFGLEDADGMNLNAYMGKSTVQSLIDPKHPGRALVSLGRTSNPDAWEVQDALMADGRPLWQFMVDCFFSWARDLKILENAGLVMGAAHKHPTAEGAVSASHLRQVRTMVGNELWLLIPGIGTQGGFIEETVRWAFAGPGSIAINSSSGIIFASSGPDYAAAAAREAEKLRDQIRTAGGSRASVGGE